MQPLNLALVGCGVIGERRTLQMPANAKLLVCYDVNPERAKVLSQKTGCSIAASLAEALSFRSSDGSKVNAVIIAAVNSALKPAAEAALEKGLHILVEKPAARSVAELQSIKVPSHLVFKVGFNHRFHPAFEDLCKEIASRPQDPILFIRAQYGNGARLGFEKEWRAKVEVSGGGELLDQGVHVLDLAQVLVPNLKVVSGFTRTSYWDMPVDDNAWAVCADPEGVTFSMHVSSSEWKNEFRFEVYTRERKYQWLGLGRSYGPERLITFQMKPEMGPPDQTERNYPGDDQSWLKENTNFAEAIQGKAQAFGTNKDAIRTLALVKDIYEKSRAAHVGFDFKPAEFWE